MFAYLLYADQPLSPTLRIFSSKKIERNAKRKLSSTYECENELARCVAALCKDEVHPRFVF